MRFKQMDMDNIIANINSKEEFMKFLMELRYDREEKVKNGKIMKLRHILKSGEHFKWYA